MRLILGSASPRRGELLRQIGVVPDEIRPADIDETPCPGELPVAYCKRIALEKAKSVDLAANEIVLCGDTTVALGRRILGKPADAAEAAAFLRALAGRRHRVISVVAVRTLSQSLSRTVVTQVKMRRISDAEVAAYIKGGDWRGKAGGYAIQGPAAAFLPWINGSYSAIVGLPLAETATLLSAVGYPLSGQPI